MIEKSTPKIRYEVGKVLRLRLTPELRFVYTNGLEESSRVIDLINKNLKRGNKIMVENSVAAGNKAAPKASLFGF